MPLTYEQLLKSYKDSAKPEDAAASNMSYEQIMNYFKDKDPTLFQRNSEVMAKKAPSLGLDTSLAPIRQEAAINEEEPVVSPAEPMPEVAKSVPNAMPVDKSLMGMEQSVGELEDAQKERDRLTLINQLGKAATLIGTGLGGIVEGGTVTKPVGLDLYDQNIKLAERPVEKVREKQALREKELQRQKLVQDVQDENKLRDPNSDISKFARKTAQEVGLKIPEATSAQDLKNAGFNLSQLFYGKEQAAARKEVAKEAREARADKEKALKDERTVRHAKDLQDAFNKDKSTVKAREGLDSALDAEQLLNSNTPISDQAVKRSLARLSGEVGVMTDQDVAAFGGSKAVKDRLKQSLQQMTSGTLTDENRQYMQQLVDVFKKRREEQLDHRAIEMAAQGAKRLNTSNEEIYEYLRPGKAMPSEKSMDPKIDAYAKQHNLSYPQAEKLLKNRGYKGQ